MSVELELWHRLGDPGSSGGWTSESAVADTVARDESELAPVLEEDVAWLGGDKKKTKRERGPRTAVVSKPAPGESSRLFRIVAGTD